MKVHFYEKAEDSLLKFAVIISKCGGKWVFCKHKERETYEVPGGHREENESILEAAKRELYEETGAVKFEIQQVCVYSVEGKTRVNETGEESYGMLYYADITEFEEELHSEIERIEFLEELPEEWTYPLIAAVASACLFSRLTVRALRPGKLFPARTQFKVVFDNAQINFGVKSCPCFHRYFVSVQCKRKLLLIHGSRSQ